MHRPVRMAQQKLSQRRSFDLGSWQPPIHPQLWTTLLSSGLIISAFRLVMIEDEYGLLLVDTTDQVRENQGRNTTDLVSSVGPFEIRPSPLSNHNFGPCPNENRFRPSLLHLTYPFLPTGSSTLLANCPSVAASAVLATKRWLFLLKRPMTKPFAGLLLRSNSTV